MESNSDNRIHRVLFVGGFQEQREVILGLCNYYCTTSFEEYSGGKPNRLEMVEKNARRLLLVNGYHMACCDCDRWDLILVWPDCDDATKNFSMRSPKLSGYPISMTVLKVDATSTQSIPLSCV